MRYTHKMVIYHVCKMVGRNTIGFQKDEILIVWMDGYMSTNAVCHGTRFIRVAHALQTQGPGFTGIQFGADFFHSQITICRPFAIVAGGELLRFLFFTNLCKVFFSSKGWIGFSLSNEHLSNSVIKVDTFALVIWAVHTFVTFQGYAFIKMDAKIFHCADD